jgi:para-aminobenzoate synthetase/4-amino-4-deoxychorismate lyase
LAKDSFILLENTKSHADGPLGYLYEKPEFIIECQDGDKLEASLVKIDQAVAKGYHLAGFMAYECAYALEPKFAGLMPPNRQGPLLWFGAYAGRKSMNGPALEQFWQEKARAQVPTHAISNQRLSQSKADYLAAITKIHAYLQAGDVYQINYTLKNLFDFEGDSTSLYRTLRASQPVEFGAYMELPEQTILSFSPELFLRREGTKLSTKPMKGTAKRGFTLACDLAAREALSEDEKSRAENLMIVDLLRNDLSRLARPGTVKTHDKFAVEAFRTLLQMTSSVDAEIAADTLTSQIIKALFPCGSITGAPKIRAIQIIRELESHARGIYTGAIGFITPNHDFCFSVPIRTITLAGNDRCPGIRRGEMGTGGGIVADSDAKQEYEECLLKARFATHPLPAFDLIETLGWRASGGFSYLQDHLNRLENSATYFDFACNIKAIRASLEAHARNFNKKSGLRVRLLLSARGEISLTSTPLPLSGTAPNPPLIALSPKRVDSRNIFLYHKTSRREVYDSEFARLCSDTEYFDVIFLNEFDQVTEGTRSNIFIEKNGRLLTPALSCGLLPGILRGQLLADKARPAHEAVITLTDLQTADTIYMGNALRGLVEVKLGPLSGF